MNIRKKFDFQQAMSIKSGAKTKIGGHRVKSWPNVAAKQLQSRKKVQQKYKDTACKAIFFPFYLTQASKIYVATSHSVVRLETIQLETSEQKTDFYIIIYEFLHKRSTDHHQCIKDCDKERLQTTAFINV